MIQIIRWLIPNSIMGVALWFGFIEGITGARNIAVFMTWLQFVLSLLLHTEQGQDLLLKNKDRKVPILIDVVLCVLMTGTFVWFGSIVTGTVCLLSVLIYEGAWNKTVKKKKIEQSKSANEETHTFPDLRKWRN